MLTAKSPQKVNQLTIQSVNVTAARNLFSNGRMIHHISRLQRMNDRHVGGGMTVGNEGTHTSAVVGDVFVF